MLHIRFLLAIFITISTLSTTTLSQNSRAALPTSSQFSVLQGSFSGIDYRIGKVDTTFPDSVHVPQGAACGYCDTTAPYANTNCICDYTDHANCGTTVDASCPPCGSGRGDGTNPCDLRNGNWTTVQFDVPFKVSLQPSDSSSSGSILERRFRVYNDKPCQALWMEIDSQHGTFIVDVYNPENQFEAIVQDNSISGMSFQDGSYYYACPTHRWITTFFPLPLWFPGTTEFSARLPTTLSGIAVNATLTLRRIPIQPLPATLPPTSCGSTPTPGNVSCLTDKVDFDYDGNELNEIFAYKVIGCRTVSMLFRSNAAVAYVHITTDTTDVNVTRPETTVWRNGSLNRKMTQTFCAKSPTEYLMLLIRIEVNVDPTFTIHSLFSIDSVPALRSPGVSDYSPFFRLQPIEDLSTFGALYDTFYSANLTTPSGDRSCRPVTANGDLKFLASGCADFYPSVPLVKTPWIPVPEWISNFYLKTQGISFLSPKTGPIAIRSLFDTINLFQKTPSPQTTVTWYTLLDFSVSNLPNDKNIYHNESEILESSIKFTGFLTDSKGAPILGSVPIEEKPFKICNRTEYSRFNQLFNSALDSFNNVTDPEDIPTVRYYTENLFVLPGYYECLDELNTFSQPAAPATYSLLLCNKTQEDPDYATDPCCSPGAGWTSVCDSPELLTVPSNSVDLQQVTQNCGRADCISTFLGDYFAGKKGLGCPSALAEAAETDYYIFDLYKKCARQVYGSNSVGSHGKGTTRCYADSDCPTGIQCDMQWRICPIYNQAQLDNQFLKCFINSTTPEERLVFANFYYNSTVQMPESLMRTFIPGNLSSIDFNQQDAQDYIFSLLNSSVSFNDNRRCRNLEGVSGWSTNWKETLSYANVYTYVGSDGVTPANTAKTNEPVCHILDFPETVAITWDVKSNIILDLETCPVDLTCLTNPTITCNPLLQNCTAVCQVGTSACVMCKDSQTCFEAPGVTTPEQCEQTKACLRPTTYSIQPTINWNLTSEQCTGESNQFCTQPCGYTCGRVTFNADADNIYLVEGGFCFNPSITSSSACTASGGRLYRTACYYVVANQTQCLSVAGRMYSGNHDCTVDNPTMDSCMKCAGKNCSNLISYYHGCGPVYRTCPSRSSCLSSGGNCTGSFPNSITQTSTGLLSPRSMNLPPRDFGACIFPKGPIGDNPNTCNFNLSQVTFGKFCLDFFYSNASSCIRAGGDWYIPPTDQATCDSQKYYGCWEVLPNINTNSPVRRTVLYGFSPKSKQDCLSPYNKNYPYAYWRSMFSWVSPQWRNSTVRQPVWRERSAVRKMSQSQGWTFDKLYQDAKLVFTTSRQITNSKAELLCKNSATVDILQFSTCSCFNNVTSVEQCISSSVSIPSTTSRLCPGDLAPAFSANKAEITTTPTSISNYCSNINVFPLPANNYKVKEQLTLASSLIKLNQFQPFDITNQNGATIGTILDSGINVVSERPLNYYLVCFLNTNSDRTIPNGQKIDLGRVNSENKILPMNLGLTPDDLGRTCFRVNNPQVNASWILVSRIENWEDKPLEYYPRDTTILLYVLAALFLVATLFCTMAWVSYFFTPKEGNFRHQTFFTIMFTFLFCIIRCIYFFMLPKGLSSQSADYVLIVLPTFFYFSSVIQLITTWVALATLSLTKLSRANKFTNMAAVALHILLYIIFLIIVLLFHFNQPQSQPSCGNRIIYSPDYSTQTKLSLAYAIIIAVFSVLLGGGFLAFGLKTVSKFKKSLSTGVKKVAITTGIYAGAFVLHCIYVFLLIFADTSVVFVFVGFIVTEVIPACYLMMNHIQYRKVMAAVATFTARSNKGSIKSRESKDESKIQMSSIETEDIPE